MQNPPVAEEHVSVFCCVRPVADADAQSSLPVQVPNSREVTVADKHHRAFHFNRAFGPDHGLDEVFEAALLPFVPEVLKGYSCALFTYGQSKSGRSSLLFGKSNMDGMVPRFAAALHAATKTCGKEAQASISCLQIYNEEMRDFISDSVSDKKRAGKKLRVIDDTTRKGTLSVMGLDEFVLRENMAKFMSDLERSIDAVGSDEFRRSSLILTFTVHIITLKSEGEEVVTGKMTFVLAPGSELAKTSGPSKTREAASVTQSLASLNRIITMISEGGKHLPYRESKLTRIMQDALGGKGKTAFLFTVSPTHADLAETVNTLDIAAKAKSMVCWPEVCSSYGKQALIRRYDEEIKALAKEIEQVVNKDGIYVAHDNYERHSKEIAENEERLLLLQSEFKTVADNIEFLKQSGEEAKKKKLEMRERARAAQEYLLQQVEYNERAVSKLRQAEEDLALAHDSGVTIISDLEKYRESFELDAKIYITQTDGIKKLQELYSNQVAEMCVQVKLHNVVCDTVWGHLKSVKAIVEYPEVVQKRMDAIRDAHRYLCQTYEDVKDGFKDACVEFGKWLEQEANEDQMFLDVYTKDMEGMVDVAKTRMDEVMKEIDQVIENCKEYIVKVVEHIAKAQGNSQESIEFMDAVRLSLKQATVDELARHAAARVSFEEHKAEFELSLEEFKKGPVAKVLEGLAEMEASFKVQNERLQALTRAGQVFTSQPTLFPDELMKVVENNKTQFQNIEKAGQANFDEMLRIVASAMVKDSSVHEKLSALTAELEEEYKRKAEVGEQHVEAFHRGEENRLENLKGVNAAIAEKQRKKLEELKDAAVKATQKDAETVDETLNSVREGLKVLNVQIDEAIATSETCANDLADRSDALVEEVAKCQEDFVPEQRTGNTPLRRDYNLPSGFPDLTPKRF